MAPSSLLRANASDPLDPIRRALLFSPKRDAHDKKNGEMQGIRGKQTYIFNFNFTLKDENVNALLFM